MRTYLLGTSNKGKIIEIKEREAHRVKLFMGNRQEYEITFDASDGDAARLARDFNFKPFFECKNGKRMKLYVTAEGFEGTTPLFKAEFRCDE